MIIGRFGNPVRVGWAPFELEWVKAALTLTRTERLSAYRDISEMTGRSMKSIANRAGILRAQGRQEAREWLAEHMHRDWRSSPDVEPSRRVFVRAPTMTGKERPKVPLEAAE